MLPYLSLAIWVPIVAGVLVLVVHRDRDAAAARWLALVGAVAGFAVTIPLYTRFAPGTAEMQFLETVEWIPRFNVKYLLGVDGISFWLVLLNSFITVLAVWAGWEVIEKRVAQYMAAFLIRPGLIIGVFSALDGMLFYVFFEAMLIPMYMIIGIWGGPNRVYAAFKFFLYTLAGLAADAGRADLPVLGQHARFRSSTWHQLHCRSRRRCCCSSLSSWPSRSRCRCGRCIPGCPTPTSKRRPVVRWCWPRSC